MGTGNSSRCSVTPERVRCSGEWGRFRREGTNVYLWLMHIVVQQKPTQYFKAIILQLKKCFCSLQNLDIDKLERRLRMES